ncbi:MAG: hypothetical protein AVDCRST_MAG85-3284 [uncultured Solirubrobacteraceae bacterium]|uniref:SCP domain-containing protein n=1 Tax=uncultured Solirubrobacteraceae bacterium TaxID=1162706 RepID=A0A6J4TMW6_9ACTN|nr:MAG: hypothetical protein AVDCRST_MAG85-3284 [uncultured Solirubrobacteraceae bacterium]
MAAARRIPILASAAAVLWLAVAGTASAACSGADVPSPSQSERSVKIAMRCLVNETRLAYGLRAVRPHAVLARAGRGHAQDMVDRGYFSHRSPDGLSPIQRIMGGGYRRDRRGRLTTGEVLAWARDEADTPATIVNAWMESPSHRRVLLYGRFRFAGVAVAVGLPRDDGLSDGTTYAMEFGT